MFIINLTVPYHRQYVLIVIACLDDLGFYRTKSSVPSPLPSAFPLLYLVALADKKKKGAGFFQLKYNDFRRQERDGLGR